MARKPTGRPNGRPKKDINKKVFENCCKVGCTKEEICSILEIGESKLECYCNEEYGASFQVVYKKYVGQLKMSLRHCQFQIAKKGNASMAIFLGKQYLGQKDVIDDEVGDSKAKQQHIVEFVFTDTGTKKDENKNSDT